MLSTSFKTEAEAFRVPPTWIPIDPTLHAYIYMWVKKNFGIYFLNSTIISLGTAILSTFFGAFAGYNNYYMIFLPYHSFKQTG
jgi:ABC-type glycerol-3-phosphate transport system permease component